MSPARTPRRQRPAALPRACRASAAARLHYLPVRASRPASIGAARRRAARNATSPDRSRPITCGSSPIRTRASTPSTASPTSCRSRSRSTSSTTSRRTSSSATAATASRSAMAFVDLRVADELNFRVGRFNAGVRRVPAAPRSGEPPHRATSRCPTTWAACCGCASSTWACCPRRTSTRASRSTARTGSASVVQLDYAAYAVGGLRAGQDDIDFDWMQSRSVVLRRQQLRARGRRPARAARSTSASAVLFTLGGSVHGRPPRSEARARLRDRRHRLLRAARRARPARRVSDPPHADADRQRSRHALSLRPGQRRRLRRLLLEGRLLHRAQPAGERAARAGRPLRRPAPQRQRRASTARCAAQRGAALHRRRATSCSRDRCG